MNTIIDLFWDLWNTLGCVGVLLGYVLRFVSVFFKTRASLAARLVAAESQLGICRRRTEQKGSPRFRFTAGFRLLWVFLSKFWAPWQAAAQLMQPATVQGMAYPRVQDLLALEVPKEARKASHHPEDAGADPKSGENTLR